MNILTNTKPFPHEKYELIEVLQKGEFATVSIYKHKKKSICFIIKMIAENNLNTRNEILNEINIGKKIRHENFAKTIKHYVNEDGKYYLVIEYIENGLLLINFMDRHEKFKITIEDFKKITTQLFKGIIYCLNQEICPVDLNPKNILIDSNCKVTFIDYGEYKEGSKIQNFHYLYLDSRLRPHVMNLLKVTQPKDNIPFSESWNKRLWSDVESSKESLIKLYTELLEDPFLNI